MVRATQVFSFVLAVAEANSFLAFKYFVCNDNEKKTLMEFRSELAWGLIDNDYLDSDEEVEPEKKKKRRRIEHKMLSASKRCVKFDGQRWIKKGKLDYPQFICRVNGCKQAIRTYCQCDVGRWLCKDCFSIHIVEEVT